MQNSFPSTCYAYGVPWVAAHDHAFGLAGRWAQGEQLEPRQVKVMAVGACSHAGFEY